MYLIGVAVSGFIGAPTGIGPFAGDYLWIDSAAGPTFSTWTDYRNTLPGNDPRTAGTRGDVLQFRTQRPYDTFIGDTYPRAGELDQGTAASCRPERSVRLGSRPG